ncbi:MAG: hypothetical protein M1275_03235 [Patescibacteria group bacterium]|nr:hypothetical protein [Patescibacteria group bacterium]
MTNFVNASLQTIATVLILSGGDLVVKAQYIGGGILLVAGFLAYWLYEKYPVAK